MTDAPSPASQAPDQAQQTIERLSSRIERVEKQLKGFQYAFPGFAILLAALLFMQLNKPSTVNTKIVLAESFGVQNDKGDVVARWGAGTDGSPNIVFIDANRKIRLLAALSAKGGPSVSLLDAQQKARAVLSLNDASDPSLAMLGAGGLPRGVFGLDPSGSGHLNLFGAAGGLDLAAHDGHVRWTPQNGAPVDVLPATK